MPNSLEQFEAKYGKRGDGSLSYAGWDFRWEAWQAGAAAATERAAKICEDLAAPEGMHGTAVSIWDVATLDCAEAIIRDRSAP
jgi:hypothetical protein